MSRRFVTNHVNTTGLSLSGLNLTFAGWIYLESNGASGCDDIYMTDGGGGDVGVYTSNGNIASYSNGVEIYAQAQPLNTWTHFALTRDGTNQILWINGAQVNSSTSWSTSTLTECDVGSFGDNITTMQDLMVFNVALSQAEIQQLMRRRIPLVRRSNLYLWWPLFGDNGTWDASGNGRTMSGNSDQIGVVNAPTAWTGSGVIRPMIAGGSSVSIAASGVTNVTGAAALTSAAALAASGSTQVTGASAITKSAALAAAGSTQVTGAADITRTLQIVATGSTQVTGAAAATAAAPLVAAGSTQTTGAAAATASAALVATGTTQVTGAATVNSGTVISIDATGLTQVTGAAAASSAASLVAAGSTQVTGAAAIAKAAPLVAAGSTQVTGSANLLPQGDIVATGTTQTTGLANVSITYSITASGLTQCVGVAVFDGIVPPGGSGDMDTIATRRYLGALGTRRAIRR